MQQLSQMQRRRAMANATGRSSRQMSKVCAVLATDVRVAAPPKPAHLRPNGIRVGLKLPYQASHGQTLGVVGSAPAIGSWTPEKALKMTWNTGNVWTAEFISEASTPSIEYKYVLIDATGKIIAWSKDPNRKLEVGSLSGSAITVAEQWDAGPREIRLIVQGNMGLLDSTPASRGLTPRPAIAAATASMDAQQQAPVHAVQGQLQEISARLALFDELRLDVARLVAGGPLPPWISAKQLMDLTQQLSTFEDLRDAVTELAGMGTLQLQLSAEQLLDVSDKLVRYEELEVSLNALVGQLSSGGGCPVGWAVGKSIAYAARNRTNNQWRPYSW